MNSNLISKGILKAVAVLAGIAILLYFIQDSGNPDLH